MVALRQFTTLDDWLAWLETLHPKKIDLSLNRIRTVLDALDLRTPAYRVITVGGTNGKGSCVALLECIYQSAGYGVGAFTSPHLWRFNERVRCNGIELSDAALIEAFERIEAARARVTLSYFEYSAVAAMLHFATQRLDVAILEVGMGGRLDAVNALDADAAMIVSVDLDHEEWLGADREAIGHEKAGIMRTARPVIVADRNPPRSVLTAVERTGAVAILIGRDFDYVDGPQGFSYVGPGSVRERLPRPGFGGGVQLANAAACVALVDALQRELPVERSAVARGLAEARVAGRLESHELEGVEWVFDVAHNPAAARCFAEALDARAPARRTLAVFGAMADKALADVLEHFAGRVDAWFIGRVDSERSASVESIGALLAARGGLVWQGHEDIAAACRAARDQALPGQRVLVFGSFYVVGPAMAELGIYSPVLSKG